jgi:hypothetical protein
LLPPARLCAFASRGGSAAAPRSGRARHAACCAGRCPALMRFACASPARQKRARKFEEAKKTASAGASLVPSSQRPRLNSSVRLHCASAAVHARRLWIARPRRARYRTELRARLPPCAAERPSARGAAPWRCARRE